MADQTMRFRVPVGLLSIFTHTCHVFVASPVPNFSFQPYPALVHNHLEVEAGSLLRCDKPYSGAKWVNGVFAVTQGLVTPYRGEVG